MSDRYTRTAAWLHWVMAVMIIVNIVIGIGDGAVGSIRVHKAIGLTVLVLSLARLGWRLAHRPPPLPDHVPTTERKLAATMHGIFYALMIIVPLAGWVMVSNAPELRPLTWFGLFDLPYLSLSPAAYAPAKAIHQTLAFTFGLLLIGHVAAALRHHYLLKDRVLARLDPLARSDG